MRDIIILACTDCKRRNYNTTKNKRKMTDRLEIKKYCPLVSEAHRASRDEVRSARSKVRGRWPRGGNGRARRGPRSPEPGGPGEGGAGVWGRRPHGGNGRARRGPRSPEPGGPGEGGAGGLGP